MVGVTADSSSSCGSWAGSLRLSKVQAGDVAAMVSPDGEALARAAHDAWAAMDLDERPAGLDEAAGRKSLRVQRTPPRWTGRRAGQRHSVSGTNATAHPRCRRIASVGAVRGCSSVSGAVAARRIDDAWIWVDPEIRFRTRAQEGVVRRTA